MPTLRTIQVPTLIIKVLEDTLYPVEFSQEMRQNIVGSRPVILLGRVRGRHGG